MPYPLDVPEQVLRRRRSEKWVSYPEDVLPLFVAETDVLLAPAIQARLAAAVTDGDTGYSADAAGLARDIAAFYGRFAPGVVAGQIAPVLDVGVGVREMLARTVPAGSRVVFTPPVYMPFGPWIRRAGLEPVEVPLVGADGSPDAPRLDLDAIEREFAAGARAILLCHPHNPTGHLHSDDELRALAEIAERHGAVVVSDEIWAPLALPEVRFRSFLAVSDAARRTGVAVSSASKAFNLAGLKCAFVVVGDPDRIEVPRSLSGAVGHLGSLAARVALTECDAWLDEMRAALASNVELLATLVDEHLPLATWRRPEAGYVVWLDLRRYPGLGENPAKAFLESGRVALSPGPAFGTGGAGFARINIACSEPMLTEAVRRIGAVAADSGRG